MEYIGRCDPDIAHCSVVSQPLLGVVCKLEHLRKLSGDTRRRQIGPGEETPGLDSHSRRGLARSNGTL